MIHIFLGMGLRPCVIGTAGGQPSSSPQDSSAQFGSSNQQNFNSADGSNAVLYAGNDNADALAQTTATQYAQSLVPTSAVCLTNQSTVSGDVISLGQILSANPGTVCLRIMNHLF